MVPVCCIYLMKMPGHNRKARTASDWLLRLQFPPELAQTRVAFESGLLQQRDGMGQAAKEVAPSSLQVTD